MKLNAVELSLFADQLKSVCEDMGQVLQLSAFSPNIRERRDFSTALFDAQGRLIAQGDNIPVHLGSMGTAVRAVIDRAAALGSAIQPGDVLIVNDPFQGGTHLPDITAVSAWYESNSAERPLLYLAARAHHADVGGISSGSLPLSSEIYQEGLIVPPVWVQKAGVLEQGVFDLLCANSRTGKERKGDLRAQLAALQRGHERLNDLSGHGATGPVREAVFSALLRHSAAAMRERLNGIKWRQVAAEDALETPEGGLCSIRLRLTRADGVLHFDFSDSDPQMDGPLNAVAAITRAAVFYFLRCLLPPEVPTTDGLLEAVDIQTRPGTVAAAVPPAAVAGGNVECSQRIVDVILRAWSQIEPGLAPALSQGTMNNLTIGGLDPRWGESRYFAYYETSGGGHGASAAGAGLSGRHTHMTNSLNTPVEALEHSYPLRILHYRLRQGSGGTGRHGGGNGLLREIELLVPAEVTMLSQRRAAGPAGAAGGGAGEPGINSLLADAGRPARLGGTFSLRGRRGDRLRIETPGGGGWGRSKP